jgi:glycosyltransferase involved in cell wall biosynthesis
MTTSTGVDLLLRAFADVASRNPEALLVLKGADDLYSSAGYVKHAMSGIEPETRKLVQGRTHYLGRTYSFRQLAQIFQAADVYVSPYRTESFNLPVLEAVATGLPVICTSGGPTDDFTTPDVALRIESRMVPHPRYEPEQVKLEPDVEHLTTLMHKVMTDRAFAETAGRCGPALVEARFTWRHAVDSLLRALGQS